MNLNMVRFPRQWCSRVRYLVLGQTLSYNGTQFLRDQLGRLVLTSRFEARLRWSLPEAYRELVWTKCQAKPIEPPCAKITLWVAKSNKTSL